MFLLATTADFCTKTGFVWYVIGRVLSIFRIVIPILIIVFGIVDLGKAVVASKDDEIKKAMKQFMVRAIAGIAIWFIPIIVGFVFTLVGVTDDNGRNNCSVCITSPNSTECKKDSSATFTNE